MDESVSSESAAQWVAFSAGGTGSTNPEGLWFVNGPNFKTVDRSVAFTKQEAHLIAAAPALLKACQQALYALKGREHDQFLRDAIAKATS